jgi:hypothetical protein
MQCCQDKVPDLQNEVSHNFRCARLSRMVVRDMQANSTCARPTSSRGAQRACRDRCSCLLTGTATTAVVKAPVMNVNMRCTGLGRLAKYASRRAHGCTEAQINIKFRSERRCSYCVHIYTAAASETTNQSGICALECGGVSRHDCRVSCHDSPYATLQDGGSKCKHQIQLRSKLQYA